VPIRLYIKDPKKELGTITEEQLQTLLDLLEEEDEEDRDYYVDKDILDYMEEEGADKELIALLRPHVTEDDGVEIEWKEE
jgi:integrase